MFEHKNHAFASPAKEAVEAVLVANGNRLITVGSRAADSHVLMTLELDELVPKLVHHLSTENGTHLQNVCNSYHLYAL